MSGCNPSGYTVKCIHTTCPQCSPFKDDFSVFFCARTCIFVTASAMTTLMIMCVNIFIGSILCSTKVCQGHLQLLRLISMVLMITLAMPSPCLIQIEVCTSVNLSYLTYTS